MEKEKLSTDELSEVLQFANALYQGVGGGYGYFNPFTQNRGLLGLNGKSIKPTQEQLLEALESSPYDYKKLAEYSSFYETYDAIYSKTMRYFIGLLSFDLTYSCKNIKDPTEYNSKEYKDDLKRIYKFFDSFDYKHEFKKILKMMTTRDVVYTWFRDTHEIDSPIELEESKIKKNENFALQIMPQDYCQLDGMFNNSQYMYSIDMNYFMSGNVDINLYAPQLKKMLRNAFDGKDDYNPSSQLNIRNGSFANYVQANPLYGAYCFKFDTSTFGIKPPFVSMLKSVINNDDIEKLQYDKNMISAYYILAGEIKTIDNAKTDKADQFKISPRTMGQFMSLVSSGIKGNVKPILMPAENIRGWKFDDQNPSMYKNQLQSSSGQGASASELIYHDSNLSQFAMQNAILTDYSFMKQVYGQFSSFLNFYVNKKTKKYKFNFVLDGLDRDWYRDTQLQNIIKMSDKGLTLPSQYWASAMGYEPQNFARALEEAHYGSMQDNLTLLMNINTSKDGSDTASNGRPKSDLLDRSDKSEEVSDYVD